MSHEAPPSTTETFTKEKLLGYLGVADEEGVTVSLSAGSGSGVEGFSSDVYRATVSLPSSSEDLQLFVKLPFPGGGPKTAAFAHEMHFYASIASDSEAFPVSIPPCRVASEEALIFTDLIASDPSKASFVGDQLSGCSLPQASAVIASLARLHGAYWNHEVLSTERLNQRSAKVFFGSEEGRVGVMGALRAGMAAHSEMLSGDSPVIPNEVPAEAFALLSSGLLDHTLSIADYVMTQETSMRHADVRLDNMIFDGDNKVYFLDWQQFTRGWPMSDVAAFIVDCLNADGCLAAEVEEELIKEYHSVLLGSMPDGQDAPSVESLWAQYKLAVVWQTIADLPTWLEQQGNVAAGKDPFDGLEKRMASLAPLIASNRCKALLRVTKDTDVASLLKTLA